MGSPTSGLEASVENCIPCKCLSAASQPHEKASADSVPAGGLQTVGVRESRELGQSGSARPKGTLRHCVSFRVGGTSSGSSELCFSVTGSGAG